MTYDPIRDVRHDDLPNIPSTDHEDPSHVAPHAVGAALMVAAMLIGLTLIYLANSMAPAPATTVHSQAPEVTAPSPSIN
jgi:hypothetical protein